MHNRRVIWIFRHAILGRHLFVLLRAFQSQLMNKCSKLSCILDRMPQVDLLPCYHLSNG